MRDSLPLHKVTLNLFEGDFQRLQTYYQKSGAGAAIRLIIRNHLNRLDAKFAERQIEKVPEVEIANI